MFYSIREFIVLGCVGASLFFSGMLRGDELWKESHSEMGGCKVHFPSDPYYVSETVPLSAQDELRYDAYIASLDPQTVFMLFIAQYPGLVEESQMEVVLNAILGHHPGNRLLFADLTLFQGHPALDFFIQTQEDLYFKGRSVVVDQNLYLMAMECEMQAYDEEQYNRFIDSFALVPLSLPKS